MADSGKKSPAIVSKRRSQREFRKIFVPIACMVALLVGTAFMLPAISMTHGDLVCDMEEHVHSKACYEQVLTCGMEEGEGADPETGEGGHKHSKDCYEKQLACDTPEHKHTDACYEQVQAEDDGVSEDDASTVADNLSAEQNSGKDAGETAEGEEESENAQADNQNENANADQESSSTAASDAEMPAQTFEANLKDADGNVTMTVRVEAPEGALPADAHMKIDGVDPNGIWDQIAEGIDKDEKLSASLDGRAARDAMTRLTAVDIVFRDAGGNEISAAKKCTMRITADEVRSIEKPVLVHALKNEKTKAIESGKVVRKVKRVNANEKDESTGNENTLKFKSTEFGTFAVVEVDGVVAGDVADGETDSDDDASGETNTDDEAADDANAVSEKGAKADAASNFPANRFADKLKDKSGKVTLTVNVDAPEGALPKGATMKVKAVTESSVLDAAKDKAAAETAIEANRAQAVAVDITFYNADGQAIEPAADVHVALSAPAATVKDDLAVVHMPDNQAAEVMETTATDAATATVEFESANFSVYALVYTVDFAWEVDGKTYEFSLPGGGSASLSQLAQALGVVVDDPNTDVDEVAAFVADVDSISFSNPALMSVIKAESSTTVGNLKIANKLDCQYSVELTDEDIAAINAQTVSAGDWALISLKPFDTKETLTVIMKTGDAFAIRVSDANIPKEEVKDGTGYIIFSRGSDNNYYVLKADGTTQRFDNADGFDELTNDYKWTVTHVYTEDELERFNIHSYTNPAYSLALNNPGRQLLAAGANNIIVDASSDGYSFTGYNSTMLGLTQDGDTKKFAGVTSDPAVMYFYEQAPLTTYKFTVTSNDIKKGKLQGRDNVGVMQGETQDCAQYTAGTTSDKKNQYTIKAIPQSDKYLFDHWELNGVAISDGATINPEQLDIPYNGSSLEAIFKVNPDYNASDDEKEGQGFDNASKAALQAWLNELKTRQVPLNPNGCKKTAEVYDYDNRIYRVDLTAQSSLTTFDGVIDLGFIMDVSGSMQFPSKLSPVSGKESYYINQINDYGHQNDLDQSKKYYLIADKAGTATVYRLFYGSQQEQTWYGTTTRTGWWAVDSSYQDNDSRHFFIGNDTRFANDTAGMSYQIYTDGDYPHKRLDYLISSVNGAVRDLRDILGILALAGSETQNPDVKIAYNTFYSSVNTKQHQFISAKTFNEAGINWATNGGTATDAAIADARDFEWGAVNAGTKNYAILITDGAPQAHGVAIDNQTVINEANDLKKGPDGVSGTADDVTLITVGLSMGDVKRGSVLLYDLADRDSDNEKLFFKADSGDELEYALYQILQKIMVDANVQGKVTDTVGDAFYPIDLETGVQLTAGNAINLDGVLIGQSEADLTNEQKAAGYGVIQEDGKTIVWNNQEFTHDGWRGTVYVKAKEDFLGGNAVRTNSGDASIEAKSYKTPSMTNPVLLRDKTQEDTHYILKINDLATPLVNVNELSFTQNETEWTVYLGTEVDPEKQLEELYKKILVEQKVTAGQDLEPEQRDNLKDHVTGGKENYLYPVKQSISDKRESEIEDGKTPVTYTMNDLLKKLVAGKDYSWWDYDKGEPKYKEFFEAASKGDGITLDYDEYGLNEKEHQLDDNTSKRDGSTINIKLTKTIKDGELDTGVDPLNGAHATKITGDAVEKYTLTVLYTPDYEVLPEGQGGKSIEDFHVGSYATMYQGHAAGTETSTNVHTINVYTKPLEVKKIDPDGATLPGAKFGIYRPAGEGESGGVSLSKYNNTLTGNYILVSEGTSDANGLVRLANTGNTEATLLVPGKDYVLIETEAPDGYERDDSVRHVQVNADSNGSYSDLNRQPLPSLENYADPYNWSQGVRISVDGKVVVAAEAPSGSDDGERELGANEQVHKADPVVFRTTIINKKNATTLDVTKRWVDDTGANKAQDGHSITFKVTKKTSVDGIAEDVPLTGHITETDGVSVNNDSSLVTLTYQEGTGWPTARITGLDKYTDNSLQTTWIYEAVETICNPSDKVDPAKAKYEVTEVNGIRTITIVNVEKKPTQINVDKKWFGADDQELAEAPEDSITFEVYRVAHIPCIHDYTNQDWVTETEATCTENGRKYRECSKCQEKEYATIPATGHSWSEWTVRTPATYTADGEEVRTCSVCNAEETRPITKLQHDHVYDELSYITEPTCTQPGTAHKKCSLCGNVLEETIEVPALGHSWNDGEVTTPATCEQPGERTFTCTRSGCGATEARVIAALGHDWVYEDNPAATCTEPGTRSWTCRNDPSHHDDEHPASEAIAALGHLWGEWETQVEATATTEGVNIRYCLRDRNHFETQTVPKTGETFGETGLPVSEYNWPDTSNFTPEQLNETTSITADGTIIKCTVNGVESYALFYSDWSGNYNQLAAGPTSDAFRNCSVILTSNPVHTSAEITTGGQITSISRGDLYQTADGEYYVFISWNSQANNLHNGDESVRNSNEWFHIQKPLENDSSNGTNANPNSLNSAGRRTLLTSPKAVNMRASAVGQAGSPMSSGKAGSLAKGAAKAADENAERKARIAALMNTAADQIIFRSELGEQSNVDVWEYVTEYTGSGANWHWALENLDAYDDDGNEYAYYVIETAPDQSLYEVAYEGNGVKDSDTGDTITINNKQKVGSVEVTKTFAGLPAAYIPSEFKITATYTVKGEPMTVDLTASSEGVTGNGTTEPYKWTINNLPIGTVVTFTEFGYEVPGYAVATNPTADDNNVVSKTATAAETPGQASFVNTYTQDAKVTLDILKIEKDKPSKKLENAVFTLREINSGITASAPSYKNENDPGIAATTDAQGEAQFANIETGYYEIRETGVPAGYVITGDAMCYIRVANGSVEMIKVNAAGDGWDVVSSVGNFEFAAASGTNNAQLTISNEPGAALPNAGGPGTSPFTIIGCILFLGSGMLLWRKRRTV